MIKKVWPFLVIFLIVGVFFWKFFFKGLIPLPADVTVGMYYPWLDYKWGYLVGVPVKNPWLSDSISQFFPFKIYAVEQIKNGIIPLWNLSLFGGYPLLANIQIGVFNPTNLFYLIFPVLTAWGLQNLFQPLLAAVFTYIFLRSFSLSKIASIFGAIVFAFSGFNLIWMQLNIHGFATAFLPLILYFAKRFCETGNVRFGVLISFAVFLQIISGYPQIAIYSLACLIFFTVFLFGFFNKRFFYLLLFIFFGLILSSIQLIPTAELFLNAQRRLETLVFDEVYLPWRYIISFFAPDYFGNPVTGNFWGKGDYSTISGYSGLVSVVLASVAVLEYFKKKKITVFFLALLLISLLLAFPTPFLKIYYKSNFFGLGISGSSRILFLANFALSCLAAFGFNVLLTEKFRHKYFKALYLPIIVTWGYLGGTILSILTMKLGQSSGEEIIISEGFKISLTSLEVGFRNLFFPSLIILLSGILLLALSKKKKYFKKCALGLFFLLGLGEIFRFGWKFTPFSRRDLVFPETPVIEYLKQKPGIFRVEGGDAIPMNMLSPYGLESFSGYDPMYPLRNAEFLSLASGDLINNPRNRYGQISSYHSRIFDLSNICYLFSIKKDEKDRPDAQGLPAYQFRNDKFSVVFSDRAVNVIENKKCFPRAFLVRNYLVESNKENIAKLLNTGEFSLRETIILEKEINKEIKSGLISEDETLRWITYQPGTEEMEVVLKNPAFVFVSGSYYPGWKALVDDQKTEVYRSDYLFRSVYVSAGKHKIKFFYDPLSFKVGKNVTFITALVLILWVIIYPKLPLFKKKFK